MGQTQCLSSTCGGEAGTEVDVLKDSTPTVVVAGDDNVALPADACANDNKTEHSREEPASPKSIAPTSVPSRPSVLSDRVPARLRESLERVRELSREARIIDAKEALRQLEVDAPGLCSDDEGALQEFQQALAEDADLHVLRQVRDRMDKALSMVRPEAMPNGVPGKKDNRWVHCEITDPTVGAAFHADIKIRFAESSERDPNGASTQLVICGKLNSYPMPLERFVSVYRETDLYRKEWIDHCERCEGQVGGLEHLWGSLSHVINASPLLPWKMELLTIREFVVCTESPIAGCGPGVLVMDMAPPQDATVFADWTLPPKLKGVTRMSGIELLLYFTPRADMDGCDVFAMSKLGVPLPQWLVPLSLVKRFLAAHFVAVFKAIKLKIHDNWDTFDYTERINACQTFYRRVAQMTQPGGVLAGS